MTFKSILVHVSPWPEHADRLQIAAEIASQFDATLVGVGAEGIPPVIGAPGLLTGDWTVVLQDMLEADLRAAHTAFQTATKCNDAVWRVGRGSPSSVVAASAGLGDLIVVGPDIGMEIDSLRGCDAGEVILMAGRPVLRVPNGRVHLAADNIVVAWKNTREARRAVEDALPFLIRAGDVVLLVITPEAEKDDAVGLAEDVAETLKRHGAPVRVLWHPAGHGDASEAILEATRRIGADLIVCGGYGHSRLGEWVFGGVTRGLLQQNERFVLFSH
jgi:nucleotide-binding universal stress UspA family protein